MATNNFSVNIANYVPIKLTRDNYTLWKTLFLPILSSFDLMDHIDGSNPKPRKFLVDEDDHITNRIDLLYIAWEKQDRLLMIWMNATISEVVLPYVVGSATASELWNTLEKRFSATSHAHTIQLRLKLQTFKKGDLSIQEYLQSIKEMSDTLAASGNLVNDADLVVFMLGGLPGDYDSLSTSAFSKLKIFDISSNYFNGNLPPEFILGLDAIRDIINPVQDVVNESFPICRNYYRDIIPIYTYYVRNYMVTTFKGREVILSSDIFTRFNIIDMSVNRFQGTIPESIGELVLLIALNLSNNNFNGRISSLGNLIEMQSLDLSKNKLFGEIPGQFTNLYSLAYLNLSHNNLTGRIPYAGQCSIFTNDSYIGNPGLCGLPLSMECGDPIEQKESYEDSNNSWDFSWEPVVIGYGCGIVIGLVIQYFLFTKAFLYSSFGKWRKMKLKFLSMWG